MINKLISFFTKVNYNDLIVTIEHLTKWQTALKDKIKELETINNTLTSSYKELKKELNYYKSKCSKYRIDKKKTTNK